MQGRGQGYNHWMFSKVLFFLNKDMKIKILEMSTCTPVGGLSVDLKSKPNYMFRQLAGKTTDIQTRFCFLVTFPRRRAGQCADGAL